MHKRFYVYVIFDRFGIPCYVGKGTRDRDESHFKYPAHNIYLRRMVAKYGDAMPVVRVRENLEEGEAFLVERALIFAIGHRDKKTGSLVNHTDGGEGVSGQIVGEKVRASVANANREREWSPESLERLSAASRERWADPDFRERIIRERKAKKRKLSPEHKAILLAAGTLARNSPEFKARLAEVDRRAMWTEERRQKQRMVRLGTKASLETRQKMSATRHGQKRGPYKKQDAKD